MLREDDTLYFPCLRCAVLRLSTHLQIHSFFSLTSMTSISAVVAECLNAVAKNTTQITCTSAHHLSRLHGMVNVPLLNLGTAFAAASLGTTAERRRADGRCRGKENHRPARTEPRGNSQQGKQSSHPGLAIGPLQVSSVALRPYAHGELYRRWASLCVSYLYPKQITIHHR